MANCKALIANFQADRTCIETFGRDDQPVNCKKLHYPPPLGENLYFPAMSASMQRRMSNKSEQNDDSNGYLQANKNFTGKTLVS